MTRMMLWQAYTIPCYTYDIHTLLTRSRRIWRQRFSVAKIGFLYFPGFWQRSCRPLVLIWESWRMLLWKVFLFCQLYNLMLDIYSIAKLIIFSSCNEFIYIYTFKKCYLKIWYIIGKKYIYICLFRSIVRVLLSDWNLQQ